MLNRNRKTSTRPRLEVERLEDRSVPAVLVSENVWAPPLLSAAEVEQLLDRAAAATASSDAIIAIVDRGGRLLGVRTEAGVAPNVLADADLLAFAIDGAIAKARTAAFFASDQAPLTSRTIGFISQSTVTEREVNSNPNIADPNSTLRGPGYIAPIGLDAHFPPNVNFTPPVDLFGIEHTNRDGFVHPGPDAIKGTADDIEMDPENPASANVRFNVDTTINTAIDQIRQLIPPAGYGEIILAPGARDVAANTYVGRGIATLPGGIPIYEFGVLVGGIGVFFPGTTGFATEENSVLSQGFDATKADRTLEAEFIGLAAVGGSSGAGFPVGALGGVAALPGFDIPFGRIDLVGITLDVIGPGGDQGPRNLVDFANANFGVGLGDPNGGADQIVESGGASSRAGLAVPQGWIVNPRDSLVDPISAADVRRIIQQGIDEANLVRAQIRLPTDQRTRMVFAVTDSRGDVLGLFRMPDATVFSLDVAVAKARNTAYYNDPNQLQPQDQVSGLPVGAALTNRTFRFLAQPRFPEGIDGQFGAFSILNDPGIDPRTGLRVGPPLPANFYQSVFGYDSFNPGTNFRATQAGFPAGNQNGIVFFPGSSGIYKTIGGNRVLVGGFGVSGDGVDQDDVVTSFGIFGFDAPNELRADRFILNQVRLPYYKFPRNPEG